MHTRGEAAFFKTALRGETTLALKEKFFTFTPA
jgi:hypothetical protein